MVKRACCKNLGTFAQYIEKPLLKAELLPVFNGPKGLAEDEQDNVRLWTMENCIALAKVRAAPSMPSGTCVRALASGRADG